MSWNQYQCGLVYKTIVLFLGPDIRESNLCVVTCQGLKQAAFQQHNSFVMSLIRMSYVNIIHMDIDRHKG